MLARREVFLTMLLVAGVWAIPTQALTTDVVRSELLTVGTVHLLDASGNHAQASILGYKTGSGTVQVNIWICRNSPAPCEIYSEESTAPSLSFDRNTWRGGLSAQLQGLGAVDLTIDAVGESAIRHSCVDSRSGLLYSIQSLEDIWIAGIQGSLGPWVVQWTGCGNWGSQAALEWVTLYN